MRRLRTPRPQPGLSPVAGKLAMTGNDGNRRGFEAFMLLQSPLRFPSSL